MPAIEIENLGKEYDGKHAVKDLDLDINRGEVFGFLGPNGAGKSTTVNMIMDYIRPTKGSITVLGMDAQEHAGKIHSRIGMLPDRYGLYSRLTGREHIYFSIKARDANQTSEQILERVGISPENRDRKVSEYSTGMRQRIALGIALTGEPEVLILDEPSRGLDPHGMQRVQRIIKEEKEKGTAVFFSSHILSQVEAAADRVGIIKDGRLVAVDSIEGLRSTVGTGSQLILSLDKIPKINKTALISIDGVTDVIFDGRHIKISFDDSKAKAEVVEKIAGRHRVLDITSSTTSLEDLFTAYTRGGR